MRYYIFFYFILITSFIFGQEIGYVKKGNHSIKLLKSNNLFVCVYSDVNATAFNKENSFNFSNKNTIYEIMMNGFNNKDHQIFVQTNKDTIVKFEYKRIKGEWMLKIKQNNLDTKTIGMSTFFNKEQIVELFGNP